MQLEIRNVANEVLSCLMHGKQKSSWFLEVEHHFDPLFC